MFVICWQIFPRCQETITRHGSTSHYAQPVLQKPCASGYRVASKRQSSAYICERIAPRSPEEVIVRLHRSLAPSATIQLELASMANVFKNESYPLLKNVESAPRMLREVVVPVMPSTKQQSISSPFSKSRTTLMKEGSCCQSLSAAQVKSQPVE